MGIYKKTSPSRLFLKPLHSKPAVSVGEMDQANPATLERFEAVLFFRMWVYILSCFRLIAATTRLHVQLRSVEGRSFVGERGGRARLWKLRRPGLCIGRERQTLQKPSRSKYVLFYALFCASQLNLSSLARRRCPVEESGSTCHSTERRDSCSETKTGQSLAFVTQSSRKPFIASNSGQLPY